jgi:transcriptional regulator
MYQPRHFEQVDPAQLHGVMAAHPLATLVHQGTDGLAADLLPLMFDPATQTLRGHVARANPLWQAADGREVLVLFQGPQAYISPNWLPGKAEHHQVVPTWNYVVVQAQGTLGAVQDRTALHALVSGLTQVHESSQPRPWAVADAPADYLDKMLGAIVGIEVAVRTLAGKWKVSQNRPAADRQGIADGLQAQWGEHPMAGLVRP